MYLLQYFVVVDMIKTLALPVISKSEEALGVYKAYVVHKCKDKVNRNHYVWQ